MIKLTRTNLILKHPTFCSIIAELDDTERNREYCIHGMEHLLNVARIMVILNSNKKRKLDLDLIYSVAVLHDIGRLEQYKTKEKHAKISCVIAKQILLDCGYDKKSIKYIKKAISTHSNQKKTNRLGRLLRKSDKLSRNCFICRAKDSCNWDKAKKNGGIIV